MTVEDVLAQERTGQPLAAEILAELRTALRGDVLTRESDLYDEVRILWNGLLQDKHPALIVRCTGVADVITAVNFARENKLLVAVRGGGHNVAGTGSCDGGMMIDLSMMKGVHVDPQSRLAFVQGGATWGDVDRETQVFNLAVPGGVVSTTGVAGLTLGGGLGHLRRKYGLTIDNLISVEIVTADGRVLTASESENSDLFWGVRGGGGNFGVVTSFCFRLHPVGPLVTVCDVWYPAEEAKTLLPRWRDYIETTPDEFSCNAYIWSVPPLPIIPNEYHFKRYLGITGVHCGNLDEGARMIKPLRELGTALIDNSGPLPWTEHQRGLDPIFPKAQRMYYFKSRLLRNLDDATLSAVVDRAISPPSPFVLVVLWTFGGAIRRVNNNATSFWGREAAGLLSIDGIWDEPSETEKVIAYARGFLKEMESSAFGGSYVNFPGFGEEGEAQVRDAYAGHYDRLVSLKNKYDPYNLFRVNQNIKPNGV